VVWVAPVVWTALEKFWPELFPNYLGASQYRLSLVTQIADLTGILGVSFLVVYINSTLFAVLEQRSVNRRTTARLLLTLAAILAAVLIYGQVRIRSVDRQVAAAEKMTIGLVQTNHGSAGNPDPELRLREHQEMSRLLAASQPLDLIVWPESVLSVRLLSRQGNLPAGVLGDSQVPTLFGAILRVGENATARPQSSALLLDGAGRILGTYDKMLLVPFGEYIPFGETFPALYSLAPDTTGRFRPGESPEPLAFGTYLLSVNICYEDIFPGQVRSLMRGGPDRRIPHVIFNLTNDSWYGDTTEPIEHLALASFRSIEHRRSLVRSTNTGISAFVDPVGRIVSRSGVWTRETLVERVAMMQGRTVYALLGDWIGWLCGLLALAGIGRSFLVSARRGRSTPPPADTAAPGTEQQSQPGTRPRRRK
jgi:apolipoprotein N-acyltransferase